MVTQKEYNKRADYEWRGVKVRTLVGMHNGWAGVAAGTLCAIEYKHGGFSLKTKPCEHCGVSVTITRVRPESVEIVEEKDITRR